MKRHCVAAIARAATKRRAPTDEAGLQKRLRLEAPAVAAAPVGTLLSSERIEGRREGWVAGHSEGVEEGRRVAAENFASDVVPEVERLVRSALSELNERYDSMFLELCREFGERNRLPRFVY